MPVQQRPALVVLISGQGRNLQAIIKAHQQGRLPVELRAVISNRSAAPGLAFARDAGIATHILAAKKNEPREDYDERLATLIQACVPDLIALAGFMRILSSGFVQQYTGKLINIHPSLLPKYRGLDTHRKALAAGDTKHGASIHFVTEDLDAGPVLLQGSIDVATGDTPEALAQRLMQQVEQCIYPKALEWVANGRAKLRDGHIEFDGHILEAPIHEDCSKKSADELADPSLSPVSY